MKKIFALSFVILYSSCNLLSAEKVFILGNNHIAVVADDLEWQCSQGSRDNSPTIFGSSKVAQSYSFEVMINQHIPVPNRNNVYQKAREFLEKEAHRTNTVFNNIVLKESDDTKGTYKIDGNYLNNEAYGHFEIYLFNVSAIRYFMFMKIKGDFFAEESRESLYKKTISLVRPLVS